MRLKPRHIAVLIALALATVLTPPVPALADFGADTNNSDGTVRAWASSEAVITPGSGGPACSWNRLTRGQTIGLAPSQGPSGLTREELDEFFSIEIDGVEYRLYSVYCPDDSFLRMVPVNVNPDSLRAPLRDEADRIIELPVPDVNPPASSGGFVNLGMWLAVEAQSYAPISAQAGPNAWMTVSPTLGTTSFSFGNGDEEVCSGLGTPIVDLDTIEEGECGYTYRQRGTFDLTITTTWELPYTSSGGSGALAPLTRTVTFDYEVREIQTVGTG